MKTISTKTFTIASGTDSGEIDCTGKTLYAIQCPASISSTAITFTGASASGGTFAAVYGDDGTAISVTVASSRFVAFNNKHIALRAIPFIKLVMGASETSKTFTLYFVDE